MRARSICRNDVKALSAADRSMLCSVYLHRCLSFEQMYQFYYSTENVKRTYAEWHLKEMLQKDYLMPISYSAKGEMRKAYFLTTTGISLVKRLLSIPSTILLGRPDQIEKYDWYSKDLKLASSKINHQLHLNEFSLRFSEKFSEFQYFDEKFVPCKDIYSMRARPDAEIQTQHESLYLELDMNTESLTVLTDKWIRYQILASTQQFFERVQDLPIHIFFILDNVSRPQLRTKTVLTSLTKSCLILQFHKNFDFWIGTPDEMLDVMVQEHVGHQVSDLERLAFDCLIRKNQMQVLSFPEKMKKSDLLGVIDSNCYAIDFYSRTRGAALSKSLMSNLDRLMFFDFIGKPVRHLTVFHNFELLHRDLELVQGFGIENSYYADVRELQTKSFSEAIFRIDSYGKKIYLGG